MEAGMCRHLCQTSAALSALRMWAERGLGGAALVAARLWGREAGG